MMHATDVLAWAIDGTLCCPDCSDGSEQGAHPWFADDESSLVGYTCCACQSCYVEGLGWTDHDTAVDPRAVRWFRCEECNYQLPIAAGDGYRRMRRDYARRLRHSCRDCSSAVMRCVV